MQKLCLCQRILHADGYYFDSLIDVFHPCHYSEEPTHDATTRCTITHSLPLVSVPRPTCTVAIERLSVLHARRVLTNKCLLKVMYVLEVIKLDTDAALG
jgi:hypothetical protein